MAGKNHHLRWMRLYAGGYDLSGDARTFSKLRNSFEEAELGGWSNSVRPYAVGGPRAVGIDGLQVLMNDAAAQGFTILKDAGDNVQIVVAFGGNAEPAIGDPAYLVAAAQLAADVQLDGKAWALAGDFPQSADLATLAYVDQPFGVLLHPATSLSSTTNGTSVDNGAASSNGGSAILQLLAVSSANFALKIQHSTDDSNWSDLITFTTTGGAITAEHSGVAGTVNRYLRFQATRTAGSLTPVCAFARN